MNNTGLRFAMAACLVAALWPDSPATAQHSDVLIQDVAGKLTTGTGNPDSGVGALGTRTFIGLFNSTYAVDDPGFNSIGTGAGTIPPGASALPGNADLSWDFMPMKVDGFTSNLLYWNGAGTTANQVAFGPPPTATYSLTLFGKNFAQAAADGSDQLVPGQVLDTTAADGFIHRHRFFFLDNDVDPNNATVATQGVYLISMRLRMDGLDRSDPMYLVWGTPMATPQAVQAAFTWVENTKDELAPSFDADFDGDLDVDGADFLTWQRNLGMTSALQLNGDADRNGAVGGGDLAVWKGEFGSSLANFPGATSGAWIAAIPEPTSCVLAMLSAALLVAIARFGYVQKDRRCRHASSELGRRLIA